jgi:hypothetical protein
VDSIAINVLAIHYNITDFSNILDGLVEVLAYKGHFEVPNRSVTRALLASAQCFSRIQATWQKEGPTLQAGKHVA